jgi:hypothetical protein
MAVIAINPVSRLSARFSSMITTSALTTGIWMLKCLPRRRNGSAMADHGEHQDLSNCFLDDTTIGTNSLPP